jgi:hypothetical protein
MKRFIVCVGLCFLLHGCASAPKITRVQPVFEKVNLVENPQELIKSSPAARLLPARETLTYEIRWLGLRVGTLTTAIKGIEKYQGRDVYLLEAIIKTASIFNTLHRIDDRIVSYMDVESLCTLRNEVYRKEGSFRKETVTEFDQVNHKALCRNLLDNSQKSFDIPAREQDMLSVCYYFMLVPFKLGDGIEYDVWHNEQNRRFFCFVRSAAEISLPALGANKIQALFLEPYDHFKEGKIERGNVVAYYSDEARRIPLVTTVRVPVFSEATISLVKIERK